MKIHSNPAKLPPFLGMLVGLKPEQMGRGMVLIQRAGLSHCDGEGAMARYYLLPFASDP